MSLPSEAAQVLISIIPIVGIFTAGVVAFFYLLWNHREKTRLIERGLYQPRRFELETFSLLAGLVLTLVGLVLSVFLAAIDGFSYGLLGGVVPCAVGVSLLGFFALRRGRAGE
jgi:hypothetical protein